MSHRTSTKWTARAAGPSGGRHRRSTGDGTDPAAGLVLTPRSILALQRTIGNRAVQRGLAAGASSAVAVQRTLKPKDVTKYRNSLKAKTNLPIAALVNLIKAKLRADEQGETVEHVRQVLEALGVAVPGNLAALVSGSAITLSEFQARFRSAEDTGIDGITNARKKLTTTMSEEIPELIRGLTTGTMFAQHDGSSVRYDLQNPGGSRTNVQIQLGGRDVYLQKRGASDKSSVTTVLIDDEIVTICNRIPAIATWVLGEVRAAHTTSYTSGNKVSLTLAPAGS